ncbi:hypothetical protein [Novosphingobium sp. FKTRR1]|uniref:hypothetical protein n=1 Tax=Novosphingobium sp. FKTRR1 TaxID=2879118 RepID=UPI001CEFF5EA|nr:hypothetical protein [Novosphingobium sp. FKTRR1]
MRRTMLTLAAFATALPVSAVLPGLAGSAQAHARHRYYASAPVRRCRHSSGTAGLIAGGAAGALIGNGLIGGPVGIAAGAVGGAFAGRAVDRTMTAKKRCR